jgi:hypothetical protein
MGGAFEPAGLVRNPGAEALDFRVGAESVEGVPFSFEFLLGEDGVDLGVAGSANAGGLVDDEALKISFVSPVMMAGARNEMVAREGLDAPANWADSLHPLPVLQNEEGV